VQEVRDVLLGNDRKAYADLLAQPEPSFTAPPMRPTGLTVDIDTRAMSIGKKIQEARKQGYGSIIVVGPNDVAAKTVTLDQKPMGPMEARDRLQHLVDTFQ
jgi:threonyl-tRNA synthetase